MGIPARPLDLRVEQVDHVAEYTEVSIEFIAQIEIHQSDILAVDSLRRIYRVGGQPSAHIVGMYFSREAVLRIRNAGADDTGLETGQLAQCRRSHFPVISESLHPGVIRI
jgi:hypothetical protein